MRIVMSSVNQNPEKGVERSYQRVGESHHSAVGIPKRELKDFSSELSSIRPS